MIILKKPEIEGCTPLLVEDSEILQPVPKNNTWYRDSSAKDYFPKLIDNLSTFEKIKFRYINTLLVYKGIILNTYSNDIYLVFTKENILYINSSSYYPKAWIPLIRKSLKEKGLNPNKCIKFMDSSELNSLFTFNMTLDFSDYDEAVQQSVMESVKNEIAIQYPIPIPEINID